MDARTLRSSSSRARILATATRNIADVGFAHITRERIMAGTGMHPGTLDPHFGNNARLLAVICNDHARALAEATGCHDPLDPTPPRAALAATAARILACIDARPDAHTVLMRDLACLPAPVRAEIEHLGAVAAFQLDCAWSALRPDLALPERYTALTRTLRSLLLRWPDWREPGAAGYPRAAADRAVAMVEATVDRATPTPPAPPPPAPDARPHPHWLTAAAAARCTIVGAPPRLAAQDAGPGNPPIRLAAQDAPRLAAQDEPGHAPTPAAPAPPPPPAHPGLALQEALDTHGLTPTIAAARLGITRQRLHELTRGTRAITPNTALRLEALLGEHAETWLARQARHDTHAERARMEA